jgi:primosomal protein N'
MSENRCEGIFHKKSMQPAPFRFCRECGEIVNPKIKPKEDCAKNHTLRKTKGYLFCPDCGEQLRKI